jgi:hypothetical protein
MFEVKKLTAVSTLTAVAMGLSLSLASSASVAQTGGVPDLEGTWSNASRTPLTRPRGIDQLVVSAEEAERIVANMSIAGISAENVAAGPAVDESTGAPPAGAQDFGLRGYNLFWTDPGSTLAFVPWSSTRPTARYRGGKIRSWISSEPAMVPATSPVSATHGDPRQFPWQSAA